MVPRIYQHTLKMGMELFAETSKNLHIMTRLSAREYFTEFCRRGSFKYHKAGNILNFRVFFNITLIIAAVVHTSKLSPIFSSPKPIGMFCVGLGERNDLHSGGLNAKRIALSQCGCGRPHQKYSAEAGTSIARCSQPSDEGVLRLKVGFFGNCP